MRDGAAPGPAAPTEERTAWSFSLLLTPDVLPGSGWRVVEERSWPTGQLDPTGETSRRALEAGGITAWRKLARAGRDQAWVEVVPYASAGDAQVALRRLPTFFVGVVPPGETAVEEQVVVDRPVDGLADPWILDKTTSGDAGLRRARTVAGAVGPELVLACLAGPVDRWTWDDVLPLAVSQVARVTRALAR
jgi:hypothetical protein